MLGVHRDIKQASHPPRGGWLAKRQEPITKN